jgi:glycerophosphoryl diester phosphodiesterase
MFLLCSFFIFCLSYGQLAKTLPNGHSHNDYEKCRPAFIKALEEGFISIEIDVFSYRRALKVAHVAFVLGVAPDLETMYFLPLQKWLKDHGQLFSEPEQRLIFMIDIKRDGAEAYALLRQLCQKYQHLITHYFPKNDSVSYGKVDILLSGHKPYAQVLVDSVRYMLIDGSLSDIGHPERSAVIAPRVSAAYHSLFKWRGIGQMPEHENKKLKNIVEKAHKDGRKVRFWAMPNNAAVWRTMHDAGVDWMNVDNLKRYRKFYEGYRSAKRNENY